MKNKVKFIPRKCPSCNCDLKSHEDITPIINHNTNEYGVAKPTTIGGAKLWFNCNNCNTTMTQSEVIYE